MYDIGLAGVFLLPVAASVVAVVVCNKIESWVVSRMDRRARVRARIESVLTRRRRLERRGVVFGSVLHPRD